MDFYHALNRGVDGKKIFPDKGDCLRFVQSMYLFNDIRPANNTVYLLSKNTLKNRSPLVDIHGWCVMKNHYHLLLTERVENGIRTFLRKLNIGYAKFFNAKYHRSGYVFQGKTKKIPIVSDGHFNHILNYIHLNPLDYLKGAETWRERSLKNASVAEKFLSNYRWSSYPDYIGIRNFPSVVTTSYFDNPRGSYRKELREYLREIDLDSIKELTLEN